MKFFFVLSKQSHDHWLTKCPYLNKLKQNHPLSRALHSHIKMSEGLTSVDFQTVFLNPVKSIINNLIPRIGWCMFFVILIMRRCQGCVWPLCAGWGEGKHWGENYTNRNKSQWGWGFTHRRQTDIRGQRPLFILATCGLICHSTWPEIRGGGD